MTNETELRDRIAELLEALDGMDLDRQAQAIIDGLGLEVVSGGGRPGWRLQIVGKWEKQ